MTVTAVRVVAQPQPEVGPVDQTVEVVDVGLLELRDVVLVQVELLQVRGQTPVLEYTDLVSGEEEFRNLLVELGALVKVVVSGHSVGEITYLVTRQVHNYLLRLGTQYEIAWEACQVPETTRKMFCLARKIPSHLSEQSMKVCLWKVLRLQLQGSGQGVSMMLEGKGQLRSR